jgi:hypothetical protein
MLATANPVDGIVDRLQENLWRTGVMVAVAIIVFMVLQGTVNKLLQWVAAVGSAWLSWELFNLLWDILSTGSPAGASTSLFSDESGLSGIAGFFTGPPKQFLVAIVAAALGLVVFLTAKKTKQNENIPTLIRAIAAFGTWAGLIMGYVVVISFAPGLA